METLGRAFADALGLLWSLDAALLETDGKRARQASARLVAEYEGEAAAHELDAWALVLVWDDSRAPELAEELTERLTALDLMGRRRMTSSVPALLNAAADADAEVRPAALRKVGELGGPAEVPALLDLLMRLEAARDLSAAERALITVCGKSGDAQSYAGRLTGLLDRRTGSAYWDSIPPIRQIPDYLVMNRCGVAAPDRTQSASP